MQEMVDRVLQREQFARMLHIAAQQASGNPVAALVYIREHLAEPLAVSDLAEQVSLSLGILTCSERPPDGRRTNSSKSPSGSRT
jgi:hypothetical protein